MVKIHCFLKHLFLIIIIIIIRVRQSKACKLIDVQINSTYDNWNLNINTQLIQNDTSQVNLRCDVEGILNSSASTNGLILTVLHQRSLAIKFQKVIPLMQFWSHWKNLIWYVENIPCGRIAVLGVLGNSSVGIRNATSYLSSLGSVLVEHLLADTNWVWAFVKCGRTLYESSSIIYQPNLLINLPVVLHQRLPEPTTEDQIFRSQFCDKHDILGELCQEVDTSTLPLYPNVNITYENLKNVPVIICAGSRLPYFYYTLKTLLRTPGIYTENIEVIIGGHKKEFIELLKFMNIKYKVIELHGEENAMLFQYYRLVYEHVYERYNATSPAAIFLDEDVKVSPDFFNYMNQTISLLAQDPSLYCINSFSIARGNMLYEDPSIVYRSLAQVSWGYAVSLNFIEEALIAWPNDSSIHALFDNWLRLNISNDRQCVYPEKTRSLHLGIEGQNSDISVDHERFVLNLNLVQKHGIQLTNVNLMLNSNYKNYITNEIKSSKVLTGNPCNNKFFNGRNGTFSFYYFMQNYTEEGGAINYQLTGLCFGIWAYSTQGLYDGMFTIKPNPRTVLYAIAYPYSNFSYLKPAGIPLWDFRNITDSEGIKKVIMFKNQYAIREIQLAYGGQNKKIKNLFYNLFNK